MSVSSQIARRDFSSKTLRALSKRGIELIGTQLLPVDGTWINPDRGYVVNDQGAGKVWTFKQVLVAAAM